MSTQKFQLPVSGFLNGLNTEATALNVLPSEFVDGTVNVELLSNGSVRRRRGVDFIGASATGGFLQTIRTDSFGDEIKQESPAAVHVELPAPNGSIIEIIVLDIDNEFQIFNVTNTGLKNFDSPRQTITRASQSYADQKFANMQFAQSGTRLFFAGKHTIPGYLSVNADNSTIDMTPIEVITRNPDATLLNTRKSRNSRWFECIEAHTSATANRPDDGTGDWERYWLPGEGPIPSAGVTAWASGQSYTTEFLKPYAVDTTPTATSTYPTTVDFYAGRLWLSGDPQNPNDIFYTQVVANASDLQRFHQAADPFDTNDSVIVDDDGSVLSLQGASKVLRLVSTASSMFLCSSNGIWELRGADGVFKATSFQNSIVLTDGIDGPDAIIKTDTEFVVFGQNSIWRSDIGGITNLSSTGNVTFESLSTDRVTTLYSAIPGKNKKSARAVYDPSARKVYYFFNKEVNTFNNSFNSDDQPGYVVNVLVLNADFAGLDLENDPIASSEQRIRRTVKTAFWEYEFADDALSGEGVYLACPFISKDVTTSNDIVVVGTDEVQVSTVSVVTAGSSQVESTVLFVALQRTLSSGNITTKGAFGRLDGGTGTLEDWKSSSGDALSFTSKIVTGFQTGGDVLARKAATYIFLVFQKVESGVLDSGGLDLTPGGCFIRTAWQWAANTTSDKYSGQTQVYIPDRFNYALAGAGLDGHAHTWYKFRQRGHGNSLQVIFENDSNDDFHLLGWTQQLYGKR